MMLHDLKNFKFDILFYVSYLLKFHKVNPLETPSSKAVFDIWQNYILDTNPLIITIINLLISLYTGINLSSITVI